MPSEKELTDAIVNKAMGRIRDRKALTPETTILNESAVSEIEARDVTSLRGSTARLDRIVLTVAERDALCATVRHLRQENQRAEAVFKFIVPNHPFATIEELAKPVLDKVDHLQSQLEQLRSTLAQVEQERDAALRLLHGYDGDLDAALKTTNDFRARTIQICKDKAEEWQVLFDSDYSGEHDDKIYYVAAVNTLIIELERHQAEM